MSVDRSLILNAQPTVTLILNAQPTVALILNAQPTVTLILNAQPTVTLILNAQPTVTLILNAQPTVTLILNAQPTVTLLYQGETLGQKVISKTTLKSYKGHDAVLKSQWSLRLVAVLQLTEETLCGWREGTIPMISSLGGRHTTYRGDPVRLKGR